VITWLAIVLLLGVSAFISGSEVAFFSLTPQDLKELEDEVEAATNPRAERVLDLLKKPDTERAPRQLLATILILNNLVNIFIILISALAVERVFPAETLPNWMQWTIHVAGITFILVLFGEVIPKVYATMNRQRLALVMARPLGWAQLVLWPVSRTLVKVGNWVDYRIDRPREELRVEDLEKALELTSDGERTAEETRILQSIVTLGLKDAKQVMTARTDMHSLPDEAPWKEVRAEVIESGFSRLPVLLGGPDEIKGILHVKDLLPHIGKETFAWQKLIRPAIFVPENIKIDDLMRDFQQRKIHIAIVVDEYGGTSGLITLEDVIEEIVGEITDEFDSEEISYSRLDERTLLIEAKTALIDLYRILDVNEEAWEAEKGESDTLGGFITEQAGRLLRAGEEWEFEGFKLEVDAADPRRLIRIKITLQDENEA
jgi:gliding motility-associated protein GldE